MAPLLYFGHTPYRAGVSESDHSCFTDSGSIYKKKPSKLEEAEQRKKKLLSKMKMKKRSEFMNDPKNNVSFLVGASLQYSRGFRFDSPSCYSALTIPSQMISFALADRPSCSGGQVTIS